jgi:hypothetical protein
MPFLIVKARNTVTGQTQKQQDLTGHRFTMEQRSLAEDRARQFAEALTARTGDAWIAVVEAYEPVARITDTDN